MQPKVLNRIKKNPPMHAWRCSEEHSSTRVTMCKARRETIFHWMCCPFVNSSILTDPLGSFPCTLLGVMGTEWPGALQATSLWDPRKWVAVIVGWANRRAEIDVDNHYSATIIWDSFIAPLFSHELCSFSEVTLFCLDWVINEGLPHGLFLNLSLLQHNCSCSSSSLLLFKQACRTLLTHSSYV